MTPVGAVQPPSPLADGLPHGRRRWRAWTACLKWVGLLSLLALTLAACSVQHEGPPPAHLTQAEIWASPSTVWEPPERVADAGDAVLDPATHWQEVPLPHARPRGVARSGDPGRDPPEVLWYRLTLPAAALAPTPEGPRLYIPRWHTLGTMAIYVDGVVVYQARGSRIWNAFNIPVWVDLAGRFTPGTSPVVLVRMAAQKGVGGAMSTVWAGSAESLVPGWRARNLLQRLLVAVARGAFLLMGVGSLIIWLLLGRRRADGIFLIFFAMSVCHMLGTLQYLIGDEESGMSDAWFSWLTQVGTMGSTLCSFYFLSRIQNRRRPRLGRALAAYTGVICLITLPLWGISQDGIFPLVRMALIPPSILVLYVAVQGAWRQRDLPSILLAAWIALSFPIGFHDLGLLRYQNLEHIYLTPYVYLGLFTMFLWIAVKRYSTALRVAERANTTLIDRLAEQEQILAETHARLRSVEREQTLLQERQRLMRDMHDGVGSSLMSALRVVEHGDTSRQDLAQVLKECIDDLKISIDSLEPVDADLLALLANLRFRMGPRLEGAGLQLDWQVHELPMLPWLDSASALHILRIIQEVLTNVIKHSGATHIAVATAEADDAGVPGVEVVITDNGRPFQPPAPADTPPARRGLSNVRSRAAALGAHIDWAPAPGGGTRFRMWLPLVHG